MTLKLGQKPIILVDMDEVLADFVGAALRVHGWSQELFAQRRTLGKWGMTEAMRLTEDEFWRPIHAAGQRFWTEIQPTPWMRELVAFLEDLDVEWFIVSAPSRSANSYIGKYLWIEQHLGWKVNRAILTQYKSLVAAPNRILIDDRETTVQQFTRAGGKGIIFPNWANGFHQLAADPLPHVKQVLEAMLCTSPTAT